MTGISGAELLIVAVVLVILVGLVVAVVLLAVSLTRRREAGRAQRPPVVGAGTDPEQRREL